MEATNQSAGKRIFIRYSFCSKSEITFIPFVFFYFSIYSACAICLLCALCLDIFVFRLSDVSVTRWNIYESQPMWKNERNWRKWSVMSHSRKTIRKLFDLVWAYLSLILSLQFVFFLFLFFSSRFSWFCCLVIFSFDSVCDDGISTKNSNFNALHLTIYLWPNEWANEPVFIHPYETTHYGNQAECQRKIIQHISQNGIFLFSIYFSFFAKRILGDVCLFFVFFSCESSFNSLVSFAHFVGGVLFSFWPAIYSSICNILYFPFSLPHAQPFFLVLW